MCQAPPPVPNAEILTEDDEFEIGKLQVQITSVFFPRRKQLNMHKHQLKLEGVKID